MWIKLSIIILIIINIGLSGQGDPTEEMLSKADYFFDRGLNKPAIKEYQRYLFMSGSEDIEILLKLAHGLYETQNYELSLQYYEKIYYLTDDPELKFHCRLKEVGYHLSQKSYHKALVSLYSVTSEYYNLHPEIIDFLFAVCHFGLEDFETAETYFIRITEDDSLTTQRIEELFSNKKKFHRPNPVLISTLSLIIPGSGQLLIQDYKEGLNSILLVGGLGMASVVVGIRYSFVDAVLTVVPWYQRYLVGGSNKAKELAIRKRKKNRQLIYLEILKVLEPYRKDFVFTYK